MKKIADISKWQGNIDWEEARAELDFVILRASCGSAIDSKYLQNAKLCGVPFGAYHYVKAGAAEEARTEARFFVQCCASAEQKPNFYIADIEYSAQTADTTETVCTAFLEELRALGCEKIGLYIGTRYKWAGKAIAMCDIMWIPRYGKNTGDVPSDQYKPKYPCDLWQYTSKGALNGVKSSVDLNLLSGDKPLEYFTEAASEPTPGTNGKDEKEPDFPASERSESTMFTNLQLAEYALAVYAAKWVYWYGTCGYACTDSLYTRKKKQYPKYYTSSRESGYKADIANGKMCADCVGFIKSFFWKGGKLDGKNVYASNNCPDRSANGMYSMCKVTGKIDTIPDTPGLIVWRSGHIGVYVGGGYTVELKGFAYDCVKKKVTDGTWTNWGQLPDTMLTYVDGTVEPAPEYKLGERTLSKGDEGTDVTELQTALVKLGYDLGTYGTAKNGVDGDFGGKTETAVKSVQESSGLATTGIFDTATYKALMDMLNPTVPDDGGKDDSGSPDDGGKPAYVLIIDGDEDTLRKLHAQYGGTLAAVDAVTVAGGSIA